LLLMLLHWSLLLWLILRIRLLLLLMLLLLHWGLLLWLILRIRLLLMLLLLHWGLLLWLALVWYRGVSVWLRMRLGIHGGLDNLLLLHLSLLIVQRRLLCMVYWSCSGIVRDRT
jgi:hypothetical protein